MDQKVVISHLCNLVIVIATSLPSSLFSQNTDSLFNHKLDSLFHSTFDSLDKSQLDSFKSESIDLIRKMFNEEELYDLVDQEIPFFAIEDVDGHLISSDLFEGKISIIHIWSIYSQPSIDQIPLINQLAEEHQESTNVFTITGDSRIDIRDYVYNYNYNQTHLVDASSYLKELNIRSIPKIIVLDDKLFIRAIYNLNDYGTTFLYDEISAKIRELGN